jgi:hypothetical protein
MIAALLLVLVLVLVLVDMIEKCEEACMSESWKD